MDDYIKREDAVVYVVGLIDRIYEGTVVPRDIRKESKQQVINEMNSTDRIPAADVRENVRGEWLDLDDDYSVYDCSVCDERAPLDVKWNFCPNCGADMRT